MRCDALCCVVIMQFCVMVFIQSAFGEYAVYVCLTIWTFIREVEAVHRVFVVFVACHV